jgi:hypothetical protein
MEGAFRDRRLLSRIAATLLALALIADRTAGRSFPVRFLVHAIFSRAEAMARAFVAMEIGADGPDVPCLAEPLALRGGAADVELLALRLRMLAAVIGVLADMDGSVHRRVHDLLLGRLDRREFLDDAALLRDEDAVGKLRISGR